jgi:acyl-coenzyme A thioesterase PaaI-like protein
MPEAPAPRTHLAIDRRLCGEPLALAPGAASVGLATVPEMAADGAGLVHGGFVFGLADYAAMLAVNEPNVVLVAAEVRFLKPVAVGERLVAAARREEREDQPGRKSRVRVVVRRDGDGGEAGEEVLVGEFTCVNPERHVLSHRAARGGGGSGGGDGSGGAP